MGKTKIVYGEKSGLNYGWGYLIPVLFGVIMVVHYIWDVNDTIKNYHGLGQMKQQQIDGVVIEKRRNSLSGESYNITLNNGTKFRDGFYYINVGDSIVKERNSYQLHIYRCNQEPRIISLGPS